MISFSEYKNDPRVRKEAEYLKSQKQKIAVISLASDEKEENYNLNGVDVYPILQKLTSRFKHERSAIKFLLFYFLFGFKSFFKLIKIRKQFKFEFIHFHNPPEFLVFFYLPFKLILGTKLILDRHEFTYYGFKELIGIKNKFLLSIVYIIEHISIKLFDRIIVVSEGDREYIQKKRIKETSIFLLPNAIDEGIYLQNFKADNFKEASEIGLLNDSMKILYQGVILKERDLDTLFIAADKLAKKTLNLKFEIIIIGDGPYLQNLKNLVDSLGLDQYVFFLGKIPYQSLANYTQIADVCFISAVDSHFWDISSPNKFTEYMCISKPIVAADFNSWIKLCGDSVFFFKRQDSHDLAELLEKILKNPELLEKKIPLINKVYKKNRWEKISKELDNCYSSFNVKKRFGVK